jgi:hypothetical protein
MYDYKDMLFYKELKHICVNRSIFNLQLGRCRSPHRKTSRTRISGREQEQSSKKIERDLFPELNFKVN